MRILPIALMLASVVLAGCKPTTIVAGQPNDNSSASDAQVALPPAISHSGVYRCDDNTLAYVDFLADGRSINLKFDADASTSKRLTTETPGKPYSGEGFSVSGTGREISLSKPGGASVHCKT